MRTLHTTTRNICWVEKVWIVWPPCLDMLCVVVSYCVKFASDQNVLTTNVQQNHFFCFQRCCVLLISFDRSSNFIEFARQWSLAKCSARLTIPQRNNMQQMVAKCCVLLGEKFGSFDRGLMNWLTTLCHSTVSYSFYGFSDQVTKLLIARNCS